MKCVLCANRLRTLPTIFGPNFSIGCVLLRGWEHELWFFLTDNLGTDIPMNLFKEIIECYHNGSNFFIKVNIESTQKHQTQIVSSQVNSFYDFE